MIEFNGAMMIIVGLSIGFSLATRRMVNFPRWHTVPLGIISAALIIHGLHHIVGNLLGADTWLGTLSDLLLWVGCAWLPVAYLIIEWRKRQAADNA